MESRLPGFYKLPVEERLRILKEFSGLTEEEIQTLKSSAKLGLEIADRMVENIVGTQELPFGLATNFRINGKDYLIPMVIEEPSVIAAASHAAKLAREAGGFWAEADESIMRGEIQVLDAGPEAEKRITEAKEELLEMANTCSQTLSKLGGGAKDIEIKRVNGMLVLHLLVDVKDAMGANTVNTMLEKISPRVQELTGGRIGFRIISNLCDLRLARARARWPKALLGEDVIQGILDGYRLAEKDIYRTVTHNKGIMNGIDAVALATGQDWRAIEAGAHGWAARNGYKPLTRYWLDEKGDLWGEIELPLAVGVVGGSIKSNPVAQIALKILGVKSAKELSSVMAAVGLAQNFAALRALAKEGIQKGHMRLHARNLAIAAGAKGEEIERIAERMVKEGKISLEYAKELLNG